MICILGGAEEQWNIGVRRLAGGAFRIFFETELISVGSGYHFIDD